MKIIKFLTLLPVIVFIIYCVSGGERTTVLCLGDCIIQSSEESYPRQLNKLFEEHDLACDAVYKGHPGSTSGEYLQWFRKFVDLKKADPDIVVLMLGTNDTRNTDNDTRVMKFKENITGILGIIREHEKQREKKIDVYLCTIPPMLSTASRDFPEESSRWVEEEIIPAIRELTEDNGLQLINLHAVFERDNNLMADVYPSEEGYRKMAKVIFNRLRRNSREYCIPCE